jgi:apolipoprotein D and lipocalin family protein
MRFSRSRTISRRIRLLHEYGKLVSKKLAMNVFGAFVFLAGFLLGAQHSSAQATSTSPLTAVDKVDLRRYAGKWYEIARYPNRFQRNCQSDPIAVYTLRGDGKVQVVNSCREQDGKVTIARGTAKVVDKKTNAKLKVTFFWPFYGDYWVIGLSPDYRYAMVGEPSRKYLWILTRTPRMKEAEYQEVLRLVETLGYQPETLQKTNQSVQANVPSPS